MAATVRAVWRDDPMRQTWRLWLVRHGGYPPFEVAVRQPDGQVAWEARDPAVHLEDPPLLELPDWLLREVVLPAAPGAPKAEQATGRVEALQENLAHERERVDNILSSLLLAADRTINPAG